MLSTLCANAQCIDFAVTSFPGPYIFLGQILHALQVKLHGLYSASRRLPCRHAGALDYGVALP